uniref:TrkH family potassium uptake protein n=1 Tax=Blautia sp. TaxID=1955243 RepID=UPI003FED4EB2
MRKKRHFTSFQIISLGFFIVILTGSLLLMLPVSTNGPGGASFWDSLFTATSAVCVTGLMLHDTAQYWSYFGQFVIMILIQIGGMGVVTVSIAIAMLSGRKIGLMQRSTMCEAISAHHVGGIVRMTGFILRTTIIIELTGAAAMFPVFCRDFGAVKGLWDDITTHKIHLKKYRMQSKVILTVTSLLILLPALYFYFVEFSADKWSGMSVSERILGSFFQSVTPRTAGFNTVDLTMLSEAGVFIMIILMITGGSPGSTAGGIKTTTIAVLFSSAFSVFRRKGETNCFHRRISDDTINHAATILLMYLVLFLTGGIAISCMEGIPILDCLFETASAIGTVGLTLGITTELGFASRLILIVLMFWGRVGGLTLVFAAISGKHPDFAKFPMEKITVG